MDEPKRVLFVCLGNICRSPLAEGIFRHLTRQAGVSERYPTESAGTSAYHAGESADPRSVAVARKNGVEVTSVSRKVAEEDFATFDLILVMDAKNHRALLTRCPGSARPKVRLMRSFDPEGEGDVPDPYYGGDRGFDAVFEILHRSCRGLLAALEEGKV